MIISFSVKNYKSIKDKVTLSFEPENRGGLDDFYIIEPAPGIKLLKLGLIYGSNGSGKTTILRALNFLRGLVIKPAEKKTDPIKYSPFLFDDHSKSEASNFELIFVHNQIKYLYELTLNREYIISEKLFFYKPNKAVIFDRSSDPVKQLSIIDFGNKLSINKSQKTALETNTLWNITVLSGFLKTNVDNQELRTVSDWFHKTLKNLITPQSNLKKYINDKLENGEISKKRLLGFLNKADFKIRDLAFEKVPESLKGELEKITQLLNKEFRGDSGNEMRINLAPGVDEVIFEHVVYEGLEEKLYKLPYKQESQGTQRYYQFSGLLDIMTKNATIFPVDEIESSLHPDLLRHFLLLFLANSRSSQLIATTHYRELLMDRDILRDDVIWFTEKKSNGSVDLFALSDFDSSVIRETSSIFNAYRSGKLGARPEVGDYYITPEDNEK